MANIGSVGQQTWRGISRDEIDFKPTIDHELCLGCGICVLNCGKDVYQFDFEANVAVVARTYDATDTQGGE
jgi:NAD-dependent dihydropyrimidine dehydrogenase PreA subunit